MVVKYFSIFKDSMLFFFTLIEGFSKQENILFLIVIVILRHKKTIQNTTSIRFFKSLI
jgi:hypothetical protein